MLALLSMEVDFRGINRSVWGTSIYFLFIILVYNIYIAIKISEL